MSSSDWIACKATNIAEPNGTKVPLRDNPLNLDDSEASLGLRRTAVSTPTATVPPATPVPEGAAPTTTSTKTTNINKSIGHPSRLNRHAVKTEVLKKYTTNQPIASFIDVEEGLTEDQKAKMLAERLGTESGGGSGSGSGPSPLRAVGNSQLELIAHVEGLDAELRRFWKNGEKVRSTRVTIQAIKMLCSPKVPQCYPSIFMLVSSVMDTFGDFVAKRLQELSANGNAVVATLLKKGQDADADLIPPEAVEVCNNWFLKISSIRELVPRICVELSLLKCFRYVSKKMRSAMAEVVERLAGQIRGVADPLVACHIRWYLFLRAQEVLHGPEWAAPLLQCYLDQLQMCTAAAAKYPAALALYAPAVQWMLDTLLQHGAADQRRLVISKTVEHIIGLNSAELTAVMLRGLPFKELGGTIGFENLVAHIDSFKDQHERATALSALCLALVDGEVPGGPSRGARTAFLSELHGLAQLDTMPIAQFMLISEALLLLCMAHYGPKQIHVMLRIIREKIADEPVGAVEAPLATSIARVIKHFPPGALLTSSDMVPLVRLVSIGGRGAIITNLLRAIPSSAAASNNSNTTNNNNKSSGGVGSAEAYATVALELCRMLEQCQSGINTVTYSNTFLPPSSPSSSPLSAADAAQQQYCEVVAKTLTTVCPRDAEGKLAFLCEARHTLSDAEPLRAALVHIALQHVEAQQSLSTRKKRNVAKVFFAFCHVTIPALQSPFTRLRIALYAAAVAFKKGLVSYGEGLLHLAVGILPDLEPFTTLTNGTVVANDAATRDIALTLLSIAAVVPPHQKYGHLFVFETLLQWTDKYEWPASSTTRYAVWLAVLRLCSRLLRGQILYSYGAHCGTQHIAADPQFVAACSAAAVGALKRLLFTVNNRAAVLLLGGGGGVAAAAAADANASTNTNNHSQQLHDVCVEGFETVMGFGNVTKSPLQRCAAAFFWRTAKDIGASSSSSSSSGGASRSASAALLERARGRAIAQYSEQEVNEVCYLDFRKDLLFERFGVRLTTEPPEESVGYYNNNNTNKNNNSYAIDAIPNPKANGPSGPSASSSARFVDPNNNNGVTVTTEGGREEVEDILAAAEAGGDVDTGADAEAAAAKATAEEAEADGLLAALEDAGGDNKAETPEDDDL